MIARGGSPASRTSPSLITISSTTPRMGLTDASKVAFDFLLKFEIYLICGIYNFNIQPWKQSYL